MEHRMRREIRNENENGNEENLIKNENDTEGRRKAAFQIMLKPS
jgi:hypothetical protein